MRRSLSGKKGQAFTAFLIDDANYIKLRDAAAALSGTEKAFAVAYDAASDSVQLSRGGAYEALGTELSGMRDAAVVQAGAGSQSITLDGEAADAEKLSDRTTRTMSSCVIWRRRSTAA